MRMLIRRPIAIIAALLLVSTSLLAALPASDAFAGTGALSGNWTVELGTPQRLTGMYSGNGGGVENTAYWSADAFGNDQWAQAVVDGSAAPASGVRVRVNGTKSYLLVFGIVGNSGILTLDGTTYVTLQSLSDLSAGMHTIYLEVVGDTLKAKVDGVQVGTNQAGGSFVASGSAGVYTYGGSPTLDDFQADTIGGGGPTPHRGPVIGVGR